MNREYQLGRAIGSGGMATVHRATHLPTGKTVAIKIPNNPNLFKKFVAETDRLQRVQHRYVIKLLEKTVVYEDGVPRSIMEFASHSLSDEIKNQGMAAERLMSLVHSGLSGLEHIHHMGVIHRDLKPSNLLSVDGTFKITDLGIAKDTENDALTTRHTPIYTAPEVRRKDFRTNLRSDLYSLGLTCFHAALGELELERVLQQVCRLPGQSWKQLLDRWYLEYSEFPPLSSLRPDLPSNLCTVIDRLTSRDLLNRYENCHQALAHLLQQPPKPIRALQTEPVPTSPDVSSTLPVADTPSGSPNPISPLPAAGPSTEPIADFPDEPRESSRPHLPPRFSPNAPKQLIGALVVLAIGSMLMFFNRNTEVPAIEPVAVTTTVDPETTVDLESTDDTSGDSSSTVVNPEHETITTAPTSRGTSTTPPAEPQLADSETTADTKDDRSESRIEPRPTVDRQLLPAEKFTDELVSRGYALFQERRYSEAIAVLRDFLGQSAGGNEAAHAKLWLARALFEDGQARAADEVLTGFFDAHPRHAQIPEALLTSSRVKTELGDRQAAEDTTDQLLTFYGDSSAALAARELPREREQVTVASTPPASPRQVTSDTKRLFDQGYALFYQGQYSAAIAKMIEVSIRARDQDLAGNAHYWIGRAKSEQGDHLGALESYTAVVDQYPSSNKVPDALLEAAKCHETLGRPSEAGRLRAELRNRFPESSAALGIADL